MTWNIFCGENAEHRNFSMLYHYLSVFQISHAHTQTLTCTSLKTEAAG